MTKGLGDRVMIINNRPYVFFNRMIKTTSLSVNIGGKLLE